MYGVGYRCAIVSFDEQRRVLRMAGDEDLATQGLRRRPLSRALCTAHDDLTVDLAELRFADTSLMLDLAMLAQRLRQQERRLVIQGAPPHVQRLIETIGLDRLPGISLATPAP